MSYVMGCSIFSLEKYLFLDTYDSAKKPYKKNLNIKSDLIVK